MFTSEKKNLFFNFKDLRIFFLASFLIYFILICSVPKAAAQIIIDIPPGIITGDVNGGGGNDSITLNGADVGGRILGRGGDDSIILNSGTVSRVNGNDGDDIIQLQGATVNGAIGGGQGNDIINLTAGTAIQVNGGPDDETMILDGAVIENFISGGGGRDTIRLISGQVQSVQGANGEDIIILDGATVLNFISGDNETVSGLNDANDTLIWLSGTSASVFGRGGSDAVTVSADEYDGSQLLDGGDDVSIADGFLDSLILEGVTAVANGSDVINWEVAILDGTTFTTGDGALEVGSDEGTGLFLKNTSAFYADTIFTLTGNMNIDESSTLIARGMGNGAYNISGNLVNNGLVDMSGDAAGDTLTVGANYSGGGVLALDIDVATDSADNLQIGGSVVGGTTVIQGNNVTSGKATGNDIFVVRVDGSTAVGDFVLGAPVVAGAFSYDLALESSDWLLRAQLSGATPNYEVYPQHLLGVMTMPNLKNRVGDRHWLGIDSCEHSAEIEVEKKACTRNDSIWLRIDGKTREVIPEKTLTNSKYEQDILHVQTGVELALYEEESGNKLTGAITGQYYKGDTEVTSEFGNGNLNSTGVGLGSTLTWYSANGFYLDTQGIVNWFETDIDSDILGKLVSGHDSIGYGVSLEVGKEFNVDSNWMLTPQTQLSYTSVEFEQFTDSYGATIEDETTDSMRLRVGLAAEQESLWENSEGGEERSNVFARANLHYDLFNDSEVNVSGVDLGNDLEDWIGEVELGIGRSFDDGDYGVFVKVNVATGLESLGDNMEYGASVGININW